MDLLLKIVIFLQYQVIWNVPEIVTSGDVTRWRDVEAADGFIGEKCQ